MSVGFIASIFAGIIGVAMLTVALGSPNLANIIRSVFDGFAGALRAAMTH
jgi:hypothetical protein